MTLVVDVGVCVIDFIDDKYLQYFLFITQIYCHRSPRLKRFEINYSKIPFAVRFFTIICAARFVFIQKRAKNLKCRIRCVDASAHRGVVVG